VLAAADGHGNADIARMLGLVVDTVRKWRKRFCREGLPGLADRPRSGRPGVFPAAVVAEVKALACVPPERRRTRGFRIRPIWPGGSTGQHEAAQGGGERAAGAAVVEWLFRRLRMFRVLTGSSEIQKNGVARAPRRFPGAHRLRRDPRRSTRHGETMATGAQNIDI
jgi:hypothetical protein